MNTAIHPYLTFPGNAEEAMNYYRSIFGGDFSYFVRFADAPEGSMDGELTEAQKQLVMHASLPVGDGGTILMASDAHPLIPCEVVNGSNFSIMVNLNDGAEAKRIFTALADGGIVKMEFGEQFWCDRFGMCDDQFGISWMVNCESGEPADS